MSWITAAWSATAGICLTLAVVHFLVWVKSRDSWASLFFSIAAVSAAAISVFEMKMMHAPTPQVYDALLRWSYVPTGLMIVSVAWFIRFYLRAGSIWLIWLLCVIRVLILVLTFTMHPSLHFLEITGLNQVQVWGEIVVTPVGVANPWAYWGNASTLLLIIITLHAALVAWRRGNHRQAVVVGSTIIGATVLGIMMSVMLAAGMLRMPYSLSLVFLIIVIGMAYELSVSMISTAELSRELSESQERIRLAGQAVRLGIWEWDVAKDEIWATEEGRRRVGVRDNEKISVQRFLQSVHPDDRERILQDIMSAVEGPGEPEVEYRVMAQDGSVRWISSHGLAERDSNGRAVRVRGVNVDITERKHYEAELEFIKKTIDVSPDAAYWMDVAGRFVYVNDVGCSSLGYSRDEMLCMSIFDIAPLASAEGWREVWKFLREKGKYTIETVHRRKDGSEFPVEITSTYVVMDGHEYVNGFARDITERKLRDDALRESLERYRAMVESFDGFVFICSADYRIEFMNQRMIEWTGRNAVGEFCYKVMHDNDSVCQWCVNDEVFQKETTGRWEVQSPKDQRWYYVVNTPIRHTDGTISKQAMIQDITERKKAELESGKLRLELAHLNRVMALSELSTSLAHEINQPLGSILNNASAAKILHSKCKGRQGEVGEILDDIITDTNRAGQIVRKIRGIIKRKDMEFESLNVNELTREVVELFRSPLNREKIVVREDLTPDLPLVRGDRVHLQQVMMNLISNATDAMKASSSRTLTIRSTMQTPDMVAVSFSDTGPGLDYQATERLFEPFYTTKKNGLGMGLRICRSIIEEHGGRIWAENNPDGGASFSFTLKADRGDAA